MYVTKYQTVERELTIWHTEGTNKRNADNPNNVRHKVSRQFRKKRRNIGKLKLMKLKLTV